MPASSARSSNRRSRGCRRASASSSSCVITTGLKLNEIADALGLAEGTVKRQLHAAIHRLRGRLRTALSPAEMAIVGRAGGRA